MRSHGINPRSIRERSMWKSVLKDDIDDLISLIDFDDILRDKLQKFRDALHIGAMKRVIEIKEAIIKGEYDNQTLPKISRETLKITRANYIEKKQDNTDSVIEDAEIMQVLAKYLNDNFLHDVKVFSAESVKLYSYMQFDCNSTIHPYWFNPKTGIMERKGGNNRTSNKLSRQQYTNQREQKQNNKYNKNINK
jgi:hypothetical protein